MRAEYDNLLESSPNIDLDIISMFNKKFEEDYPNVRKPVICNGLREIKPFYEGQSVGTKGLAAKDETLPYPDEDASENNP